MKKAKADYAPGFHILAGDDRSQAGTLVIQPGRKVGGPDNKHRGADQWIYVESGSGEATIDGKTLSLEKGSLILIQRTEPHGFRNTGDVPLNILTFYVPPAYDANEDVLPAGMP
jgi:mannose-6-phosphate isomerase-like protein (cupin superfamily)